jgi:hypothetical protein
MSGADDRYRTLKPTDAVDEADGTLAPRPAPRRAEDFARRRPPPPPPPPAVPATVPPTPAAARVPPRPAPPAPPANADGAGRSAAANPAVLVDLYRLMKQRRFVDAVRLLAGALPRREAVTWACRCVRGAAGAAPSPADGAALAAAEAWEAAPSDARSRAAGAAASAAGYGGAAGSAALAAFLSGGGLALPDARPGARAVGNAVVLAAEAAESGKTAGRYFQFLKEGIGLLTGVRRARGPGAGAPSLGDSPRDDIGDVRTGARRAPHL